MTVLDMAAHFFQAALYHVLLMSSISLHETSDSSYRDEQGNRKHRLVKYLGAPSDEEAIKIRTDLRKRSKAGCCVIHMKLHGSDGSIHR
ncbi:hypothetical protein P4H61_16375 [Paenibacillus peoriae]|uniref:hypothetical protein n=1 Tax=Paenibacillus peoriae TaxID=59893 RepID=UPI00026C5C9D|nr:hypothetical protein [Paenibacillus peoriae]MEC0183063.1 hypothetical protein [Paenibacillus peoriae]